MKRSTLLQLFGLGAAVAAAPSAALAATALSPKHGSGATWTWNFGDMGDATVVIHGDAVYTGNLTVTGNLEVRGGKLTILPDLDANFSGSDPLP